MKQLCSRLRASRDAGEPHGCTLKQNNPRTAARRGCTRNSGGLNDDRMLAEHSRGGCKSRLSVKARRGKTELVSSETPVILHKWDVSQETVASTP